MKKIDINCDVGEGLNNEDKLMPYIQSCNIACGGHAGNSELMRAVAVLAIKHNVKIGAHPSYPDTENFGRISLEISPDDLIKSIRSQINDLIEIINNEGGSLHHIKPHGALYNDIVKNEALSLLFLEAILPYKTLAKLYVPYNSVIEKNALKKKFSIIYEAFADRNYNDDLSLVSRQEKNALITSPALVLKHLSEIINNELVTTISGKKTPIKALTFCVHSDTENVIEIVKRLYEERIEIS